MIPDNMLIAAFNYQAHSVYYLLNLWSNYINQPFKILQYFPSQSKEENFAYGLFYASLEYFNTRMFLIKNFYKSYKSESKNLFEDGFGEMEYFIPLSPSKMYVLVIYSDELKDWSSVQQLLKTETSEISIKEIRTKKLKEQVHNFIEQYWPKSE